METRVSGLEDDVHDMKRMLNRLENTVVPIEATPGKTCAGGLAARAVLK
jgi:hypothetical protein